jgi:tetratricopeptide (TPR) repeat protein
MAVRKLQVFLASRFRDFDELRLELKSRLNRLKVPPVEAVDLNDNAADPHPPLGRCYEAIDNAELFVLLVGDKYGGSPKDHEESYTHLEYRRALSDGSKTILPFLIGHWNDPKLESHQFNDRKLGEWVNEIRDNHTPSYLDLGLGAHQLASDIFDEVLARLIELFADVDDREFEDASDETEVISEDSPIKREQLANAPRMSADRPNSEQPLRMLAANHAEEALAALNLDLPHVAIHHLRKAVDLVPLDMVLGYWLSRLLVATGRRRECLEARRTALQCARVAAGQESEFKLETMACHVLAARASERLGELDVAKEFARAAYEEMPYHWLATLEYGRQLAFAGDKVSALKLAEDTFWLRSESIRQLQRDPAYRGLRKDFDDFRARLRQTVTEETEDIARVEALIRQFTEQLGVAETDTAPLQDSTDLASDRKHTIRQLIHSGQLSVKSSLQILQQCAARLSADSDAFTFDTDKGLTPAIGERIEEAIRTAKSQITTLNQQHAEARHKVKHSQEQRTAIVVGSLVGGVLLLAIAAIAVYSGVIDMAATVIAILIVGVSLWVVLVKLQSLGATHSKTLEVIERIRNQVEREKSTLAELTDAMLRFKAQESKLRENTTSFCGLVDQFERTGLRRLTFSPAPPLDRKGNQEQIGRTDDAKASSLGLEVDVALLPVPLRFLVESSAPKAKYWLARRLTSGATETLSRSAAYFH